jgi:hypothetical protein
MGDTQWRPVQLNDTYCPGDTIRVQERSRADVALMNQSVLRLNANTTITLEGVKEERTSLVNLLKGAAHFFSRGPRSLEVYHYVTEERERHRIKGAFTHYVAPVVIEEMLKDPGRLQLGGEEKVLTVLFSDLQGFTSHSERYTPHQMIELLSEYYARMTEQIFAHEGML